MKDLTINEIPKTKAEFIRKWESDHIFRQRAEYTGFNVLFGSIVICPNGKVAGAKVK